jgi:hypothetical protein
MLLFLQQRVKSALFIETVAAGTTERCSREQGRTAPWTAEIARRATMYCRFGDAHQKPPFSETLGFSHGEEKMGAIAHFSLTFVNTFGIPLL